DIDSLLIQPDSAADAVTLDITGGKFRATNISNLGVSAAILVEAGATLQVGGADNGQNINTIHNIGSITLAGTLLLDAQTAAAVLEATAGGTLDINDTVTNDPGGTILASGDSSHLSTVTLEANVLNNGQLEANAYGTLDFHPPGASTLSVTNNKATNGIVVAA